jgi:hypothetical protein
LWVANDVVSDEESRREKPREMNRRKNNQCAGNGINDPVQSNFISY